MSTLHSSTSVSAMLVFWRQQSGEGLEPSISDPERSYGRYVRLLTSIERAKVLPDFSEGNPTLPWFGCFCGDEMLGFTDDYAKMLTVLKKANYRILDLGQLG